MAGEPPPILSVRNLTTSFKLRTGWFPAVRKVAFDLRLNETLCLVGESGCGKSVTAMTIMGLLSGSKKCRVEGEAVFEGRNLIDLSEAELQRVRGHRMSMIFQEPMTSLNPVLPIGQQVGEPLVFHRGMSRRDADIEALRLLDLVKIPDARERFRHYPHQFSGGMRQRVMIAMAMACQPDILFADEPTTALDVTIQGQVLSLLDDIRREKEISIVLITHDMGVVASVADRVAVMYAGEIVEISDVDTVFSRPTHPYTEALLRSIPRSDQDASELIVIDGQVPAIDEDPAPCRFAPRCGFREGRCDAGAPMLADVDGVHAHHVRCHVRAPHREARS